jgi:ABC-type cobalamin/Fe3+-siderophores transport system ATPase subunit
MNVGITLKNYRCFPDDAPAKIKLENGLTALVGTNNSGKSTVLKFFWEFRNLFNLLGNAGQWGNFLNGNSLGPIFPSTVRDPAEVFCNRNARDLSIEFDLAGIDNNQFPVRRAPHLTRVVASLDRKTQMWQVKASVNDHAMPRKNIGIASYDDATVIEYGREGLANIRPIIEMFGILGRIIYVPAYRNAINAGATQPYFDIQTGQSFIGQWRTWQAGDVAAHRDAARRMTDTIGGIFGYRRLEVNAANSNETLVLVIDDKSYLLPELGSGIAQFLMVLANAAIKNPPFILIDEPELNLHPSLQRKFLQCLASYATQGVVFATHNLGLALTQADKTYSVQRIEQGHSQVRLYEDTQRLSELLGELSFAGYKELGFEKILLVEGVTDMRAIQHFLSFYGRQNRIVLLPLGGNTLINGNRQDELQEVLRICPHVHALIDSEKPSAAAELERPRQDFHATCARLTPPIPCHVLTRRSTENYFTDAAVKAVLGPTSGALGHYDRTPDRWKNHNWRIAQEMQQSDLHGTDLGTFLESL